MSYHQRWKNFRGKLQWLGFAHVFFYQYLASNVGEELKPASQTSKWTKASRKCWYSDYIQNVSNRCERPKNQRMKLMIDKYKIQHLVQNQFHRTYEKF